MDNVMCFYHAISRKHCGYIKSFQPEKEVEYLPHLNDLLKDMLFELSEYARYREGSAHFRIEIYIKNDSPQMTGYTVWMVLETSLDQDAIHTFIETLATFGEYYRTKGE